MKAIVINLESETERMDFQRQQLETLGIEFDRLSAVRINDKDASYRQYMDSWERRLSPPEVGCFLSHKHAWEIVRKVGKPCLILEDDIILADNIARVLNNLSGLSDCDYVNLEVVHPNKRNLLANKQEQQICGSDLVRMYQGRSGAGGYVLWPTGAEKLLRQAGNSRAGLADKFINANYELLAYQIDPAVSIQMGQCVFFDLIAPMQLESTISPSSKDKLQKKKKEVCLRCRFRRLLGQIKTGVNHMMHMAHARKRPVMLSPLLINMLKGK